MSGHLEIATISMDTGEGRWIIITTLVSISVEDI